MLCRFKSLILIAACIGMLTACGGSDSSLVASPATSQNNKQIYRSDKAIASDYQTIVQELYISYFGRPADPTALANFESALIAFNAPTDLKDFSDAYATDSSIRLLVNSFSTSNESVALYGAGDPTAFVTAVFNNVLNRPPQQAGLAYWVNAIKSGSLSQSNAALAILSGALKNESTQGVLDAQLINNRLIVASYFTAQVYSSNAASSYAGASAAAIARNMLTNVTSTTDTTAYEATVINVLLRVISAPVQTSTGQTSSGQTSTTQTSTGLPSGASARCADGTYSFSVSRSGTCSHHGGVAVWL